MCRPSEQDDLRFVVVGMSDEDNPLFTEEVLSLISIHKAFSGGKRHRELVSHLLPEGAEWIDVTVPLSQVYERYRELNQPILVFASGDPLFFGYTTTLMREFPGRVRRTFPSFNSLQLLSHALTLPYHDMRVVSLTGRPWQELDRALIERAPKIGILTDRKNTPEAIAARLIDYGYTGYRMHIGVKLGGARQQLYTLSLQEARAQSFDVPNCVIIECLNPTEAYAPVLGLSELDFMPLNGRVNMITKMPIRLLSLSLLELHRKRSLWDIGFCTGSVSIEARLQFPHLSITSFEIRAEGEELMRTNSRRFGAPGIEYHIGDFLSFDLSQFAPPEAAFIGGHGGKMGLFIDRLIPLMEGSDPCIVFNSVSEDTLALFREAIDRHGWRIAREMKIQVDEHNPIVCLQAKP